MTSLLFKVKASWTPSRLWREIVIGANRSLEAFQKAVNRSFGLEFDHLWFMAKGVKYWDSPVKYLSPLELETQDTRGFALNFFHGRAEEYNAAMVTLGELNLIVGDRMCYLYDYGDEWRFLIKLVCVNYDDSSNLDPIEVNRRGDDISEHIFDEGD